MGKWVYRTFQAVGSWRLIHIGWADTLTGRGQLVYAGSGTDLVAKGTPVIINIILSRAILKVNDGKDFTSVTLVWDDWGSQNYIRLRKSSLQKYSHGRGGIMDMIKIFV